MRHAQGAVMLTMRLPKFALCLSLVGAACAIHLDGDHWNDMDRAIDRAAAEVNLHYVQLTDAATVADARAEVARHAAVMVARLDDLRARVDDSGCLESDGSMNGIVDSAVDRLDAYVEEMAGMNDVLALRDASERYGDDMNDIFGRMMIRRNEMRCP
jgi:hypothetical protein